MALARHMGSTYTHTHMHHAHTHTQGTQMNTQTTHRQKVETQVQFFFHWLNMAALADREGDADRKSVV